MATDSNAEESIRKGRGRPTKRWVIYRIHDTTANREYVGVTQRELAARLRAHAHDARRRCRGRRRSGLAAAIRACLAAGRSVFDQFSIEPIVITDDPKRAQDLEQWCIDELGTAAPNGYNSMPGGSLGGPGNAKPVILSHPTAGPLTFTSLYSAISYRNGERKAAGSCEISPSIVYARVELHWSVEEALEYRPRIKHAHPRDPFVYNGQAYSSVRAAAQAAGIGVATLRSKLYRLRKTQGETSTGDVARDRRTSAARTASARWGTIRLPDPDNTGAELSVDEFARRLGLASSTVLHRWRRLCEEATSIYLSPIEIIRRLSETSDRRKTTNLRLPDGQTLSGGEREVIARFIEERSKFQCDLLLSVSGIRRRLRTLGGQRSEEWLRWAFGIGPRPGPHD